MPKSKYLVIALVLACTGCGSSESAVSSTAPMTGIMAARDDCPADGNIIITLEPGDRVTVYKSIAPTDQADRNLPPDSPLSKKMNLSYVKALSGKHSGEYCWASTVNITRQP